ncbi:MAG: biotin/lipoyl-binding protein, partial [Kiritimatiellae bacterium]|nr:biotin/lipoyl-binding protein [Kiritimatiellia bacterium]
MPAHAIRAGLLVVLFSIQSVSAQNVSCLGQVLPGEQVIQVAAPADAIIGELSVRRGSQVKQGDVMAVLRDAPLVRAQLDRARRQVELAGMELQQTRAGERLELVKAQQATIEANQAEATLLESRLERYAALLKEKHVEQDRYDEVLSELTSLRAKIQREKQVLESLQTGRPEEVSKAEINVQLAEAQLAEASAALALQNI